MRRGWIIAGLAAVAILLLVAVAHTFHAAFFGVFGLSAGDVGQGLHEQTLHLVFPALLAIAVIAGTALVAWGLRWLYAKLRPEREDTRTVRIACSVLAVLVVGGGLALAVVVAERLGRQPDVWDFIRDSPGLLVAVIGAVLVGLAAVAVTSADRWRRATLGASAGVALVVAFAVALVAADRWGEDLGRRVAAGAALDPAFNPLGLRIARRCVDGRVEVDDGELMHGVHLLLGRAAGAAFVVDLDRGGTFRLVGQPLRIEDPVNDACRGDTPPAIDDATAEQLAERFRPLLLFDRLEPWRPLEIGAFLNESFPDDQRAHVVCPRNAACRSAREQPALRSEAGARLDLHDAAASPLPECHAGVRRDCDEGARSAIYYRVSANTRGRILVDYWWFLRYNHFPYFEDEDATCGGRRVTGSNHEGDWEGVTVVARVEAPDAVETVLFSAHGHSFGYRELPPRLRGTRPLVFIACGSHAAYPRACGANCRQTQYACDAPPCRRPTSGLAEAPYRGSAAWGRNEDPACYDPPDEPCLRPLPEFGDLRAPAVQGLTAAVVPFTSWPGTWGESGGPASPAGQRRFSTPWLDLPTTRTDFGARERVGDAPEAADID